jgi:hypothetical protein
MLDQKQQKIIDNIINENRNDAFKQLIRLNKKDLCNFLIKLENDKMNQNICVYDVLLLMSARL